MAPMGHREGLLRAIADLRRRQDAAGLHPGSHAADGEMLADFPWPGYAARARPASAGGSVGRRAADGRGAGSGSEDLGFLDAGPRATLAAKRQRVRILHEMERSHARAALRRACAPPAAAECQAYAGRGAAAGQLGVLGRRNSPCAEYSLQ